MKYACEVYTIGYEICLCSVHWKIYSVYYKIYSPVPWSQNYYLFNGLVWIKNWPTVCL